jgi:hypothetical protein
MPIYEAHPKLIVLILGEGIKVKGVEKIDVIIP